MIAAILAAMMSTCDALMLSASALLTRNIYKESFAPDRSEKHYILVGRVASIAVVVVAASMAFGLGSVLDGLKHVWALLAMMGLAWWGGVIWPRATTAGAWASTIAVGLAYASTVLFNQLHADTPRELKYPEQIAIYLSCGLIVLVVTSLLTTHTNPDGVRRFYRKMRTPTTVRSEFDADE
jgi:Na+/proline symporter